MTKPYETINRESLATRLRKGHLNNNDPREGFALVNVLKPETFEKEHIPGSINIPRGDEESFDRRFDRNKEIMVYCASPDCTASREAAETLTGRGFTNVKHFKEGMEGWKEADQPVESGAQRPEPES